MKNFNRICAALFTTVALAVSIPSPAQQVQTVNIGFSSPLSGPQASAGLDNQGGLILAIEHLNAQGIVIGGKKILFHVIMEDDQGDPATGVQVAQKLVDAGVKAVIGPYNSGISIPASRIYDAAGIVMATVSSNPSVTLHGYKTVFRIAANDSQLGGKIALYAARELKIRTVAIIDDRTAYGQGLATEFAKVARANGLTVVSNDYTSDKASDFMAILTRIKPKNPDAIFYAGYAAQAGPMVRQMKQLKMQTLLLGSDGICAPQMGRLAGDAITDQVYCTEGGALLDKLDAGKSFADDYKKRFNRPPETYAVAFYDGMMLIAEAMKHANSVEPQQYLPALEKIKFKGVVGTYEFDAHHDLSQSVVTIYHFHNGAPESLTSY